jgi:hypothetical protein
MTQKPRSSATEVMISSEQLDLFFPQSLAGAQTESHVQILTKKNLLAASTTGLRRIELENVHNNDRLFVPISREPFHWFDSGEKLWELRRYGRQYTEKYIRTGRKVELRRGYKSEHALWGRVGKIVISDTLAGIFTTIPYKQIIPTAYSLENAIEIALQFVGPTSTLLIAFEVKLAK